MKRQKNEDFDECSQLRFRSKRTEEEKIFFKTNLLVPEMTVKEKEEGATAAASHLPSLSGPCDCLSLGRTGRYQRSPNHREILIKYQKRPTIVSSRRQVLEFN
jgi:hypothetical protein